MIGLLGLPGWVGNLAIVALGLTFVRQCRKPKWGLGRLVVREMNARHRGVTAWGLSHVTVRATDTILDVGCGGGRTIATLAEMASQGKVYGVDYSTDSVATARATNSALVREGRVDVRHASVSKLPFTDRMFDLVTAVETHYYWPDLKSDLEEVRRTLKSGGRVLLIAETYKGRTMDWLYRPAMMLLGATYLTPDEHRAVLASAGFADVQVFEESKRGWICALGRAP
jgi:ubiquinone/menaquinone biosynthesis C-methylase UbiE